MRSTAKIAIGIGLMLGAPMTSQAPAAAQPAPGPALALSKEERAALLPVQNAVTAKNWAAAEAGLAAATAAARSPDARYALGRFQLEIGLGRDDFAQQRRGLETLIGSGKVATADLPAMYRNLGVLADKAGEKAAAEAAFARVVQLTPDDPEALISLAQVRNELRKPIEAVELISKAIALKGAAGQKVDESWYKYALKLAFDARQNPAMRDPLQKLTSALVAAYPTKENWRDAALIFRDTNELDAAADLDLLRFMRASGALAGERDWYDLVDGLYKAGNYAEAKAVLDDGTAKRMIDSKKAAFAQLIRLTTARMAGDRASLTAEETKAMAAVNGALAVKIADAFYGYGEHEKAITLYRAALRKGGVEANMVNTRLAMALLASGDRPGAEAALKSLQGVRRQLGSFWLAWLARRSA